MAEERERLLGHHAESSPPFGGIGVADGGNRYSPTSLGEARVHIHERVVGEWMADVAPVDELLG